MKLSPNQRYFTPANIIDRVIEQWGKIDCDPCYDPESLVQATVKHDAREGTDGLLAPWTGVCFVNPPYDKPAPWVMKALSHSLADPENEAILLLNVGTGVGYWTEYIWPFGSVCFIAGRLKFGRPEGIKSTWSPTDSCLVYFGQHHEAFKRVWSPVGAVVRT